MRKIFTPFTLILSLLLVFTAGCGSNTSNAGGSSSAPGSTASSPSPSEETTKSIKHAMGTTKISGTPKRIVVLEWTYAEDLLAVGVQPVGMAEIENYKKWVHIEPQLGADVVDVGTRQEPNLEMIAGLKPDLIIAVAFRAKNNYKQLSEIAPTLVFDPYPADGSVDQYEEMEQTFKTIADVMGKQAEAEKVLQDLQKTYDDAKGKLKKANKEGAEFVLAQAVNDLMLFTQNSLAVETLERIGLKNSFHSKKFEQFGTTIVTIEALPALQHANFLYVVQDDRNIFEKELKNNAVWNGLQFVKENRTYALGGDTWTYGGPLSTKLLVDRTVGVLTK